jgi:hypothetical protein
MNFLRFIAALLLASFAAFTLAGMLASAWQFTTHTTP